MSYSVADYRDEANKAVLYHEQLPTFASRVSLNVYQRDWSAVLLQDRV